MVVYERAEKILALSHHPMAGPARRIDCSYVGIGSGAVHLHYLLEWSAGIGSSMFFLLHARSWLLKNSMGSGLALRFGGCVSFATSDRRMGQDRTYLNTNDHWDDPLFGFVVFTDSPSVAISPVPQRRRLLLLSFSIHDDARSKCVLCRIASNSTMPIHSAWP